MTWTEMITRRVCARVPRLKEDEDFCFELIITAFNEIMKYTKADEYDKSWDNSLVECVVRLYNYSGIEGSIKRENDGVKDEYESSNIIATVLTTSGLPHYIRPIGYKFNSDRFNLPE